MKRNKTIIKEAKRYAILSLDTEGFVDEKKVVAMVSIIQKNSQLHNVQLLKAYRDELEKIIAKYTAHLKSAVVLSDNEIEKITAALTKVLGHKVVAEVDVDPELISGLQVRLYDTIYENSIKGKFNQIKERVNR